MKISGKELDHRAGTVTIEVMGRPLSLPQTDERLSNRQAVTLVVHPEAIRVGKANGVKHSTGVDNSNGGWTGAVHRSTYLGNAVDYEIQVGDHLLYIQDTNPLREAIDSEGESVGVDILESSAHILTA